MIDDGSRDDTARSAAELGANVVSLPVNLGYGGAVQTGFRYAVRHGYDLGVVIDADGQHDPAGIHLLADAVVQGGPMSPSARASVVNCTIASLG